MMPDAGSGSRAASFEHGRGVLERQHARERPAVAVDGERARLRRVDAPVVHLAGVPWFFAVSVLIRPSTPPFLICSLNSSR